MYCTWLLVRQQTDRKKAGFQVGNAFSSFALVAHLYNAAKQMHLLKGEWKPLDSAIKNNISKLFHGDLPTTPKHIFSRYCLCFNLPATAFARDYRGNRPASQTMLKKAETLLQLPLLSIYLGRYLHGLDSPEKLLIKHRSASRHKRQFCENRSDPVAAACSTQRLPSGKCLKAVN